MGKGTVLVVEDDPSIRDVITRALEEEGYRVYAAVGGAAPALARAVAPDMVLLDVMMPGMDGPAVSLHLRHDTTTAHIPIVAMSTLDRGHIPARMQADDWLQKPFDLADLYRVVERWIRGLAQWCGRERGTFPAS